ncbi:MAG TPA: histidine phosphatase family protein [Kribbella sp.]|nr:histidine phosphatase family protein [Amycolatopsis sp.]HWD82401.1 histidine phosphatase family protein [Kribbella sp.]
MILSLIRHGEPARGAGDPGDPPLSPAGRAQLEATRALVEADGYDAVYCSPLLRARQSAEIVAPGFGPQVDADLAEFDRGSEKYLHWEDGADVYQSYLAGDLSPWGTTLKEFRHRIHAAVDRIHATAAGERVLVVTHGGVINNFFASLIGSAATSLFQPRYGSVNRFQHRPGEGWKTVELNATGSLLP